MNKLYICILCFVLYPLFSVPTLKELKDTTVWQEFSRNNITIYNRKDLRRVPILCFHIIGEKERYEITPENFSNLLEYLNSNKFWLVSDKEFLGRDLSSVPTGYKPIVLGSDDASEGNFLYKTDGDLSSGNIDLNSAVIVKDSMVAILERYMKPRDGKIPFTFYVSFNGLPFRQTGSYDIGQDYSGNPVIKHKFNYLLDHFIVGNHTYGHPVTRHTSAEDFKKELDEFYGIMKSYVDERIDEINTLAYPHGCAELKSDMREMLEDYHYDGVIIKGGFDFDGYFSTSPYNKTLDSLDISRLGVDNKNISRVYGWLESVPLLVSERVLVVDDMADLVGFNYNEQDQILIRGDL